MASSNDTPNTPYTPTSEAQPKETFSQRMFRRSEEITAAQQAKRHPVIVPAAAVEAGQLVKVYRGKNMDKDFQRELAVLAKDGWRVQSQSYGGQRGPGVGKVLLVGVFAFAGGRKPGEMTVVYKKE